MNRNDVKFWGKSPADIEYENNEQTMQSLNTERSDITTLLGMEWLREFNPMIRNIRLDKNSPLEMRRIIEMFPN